MELIPAWAIKVDQNDRLIFQYITAEDFMSIEVRVRQINPDGQMVLSKFVYTPGDTDTRHEETIILGPGYLVSVSIITDTVVVTHGNTFGRITLNRLEAGEPGPILELAAGYVFDRVAVSWPSIEPVAAAEQRGADVILTTADPSAGANISYQSPANVHTQLKSAMFTVVTSATVATRRVRFRISLGATIFFEYVCTTTQAESLTRKYVFAPFGTAEVLADTTIHCPVPVLDIPPGDYITTSIDNLQVDDNVSGAWMLVNKRYSL